MTASESSPIVLSLADVDDASLALISKKCKVPVSSIEDIYTCTSLQQSMISERRDEIFHIVLSSFGPEAHVDRFCKALCEVVAHNAILRTRIVRCDALDTVQVVIREHHVTERDTGYASVEDYLRDNGDGDGEAGRHQNGVKTHHRLRLGEALFRSAFIGRTFVATIHHAVMDYWSMTTLLGVDVLAVYQGKPLIGRPPFKSFVRYCLEVSDTAAKSFWASRFKGSPTVFPAAEPSLESSSFRVIARQEKKMPLRRIGSGHDTIPTSHIPYFIEAAWALTASIYSDSDSVAYGYVLSGRSPAPGGVEATLGPTVTEVPVQTVLYGGTTVGELIKGRAASLRQLQQQGALLHCGPGTIAAASDAARAAVAFRTLINIRPPLTSSTARGIQGGDLERVVWLHGEIPLQLIFSILDDGVMVLPRADPSVLGDRQLGRVLHQLEHALRALTEAPPRTRLEELDLLDPRARSDLSAWNREALLLEDRGGGDGDEGNVRLYHGWGVCEAPIWSTIRDVQSKSGPDTDNSHAIAPGGTLGSGTNIGTPVGCAVWIVDPQNTGRLAPLGGVGEVLVEAPGVAAGYLECDGRAKTPASFIAPPRWASSPHEGSGQPATRFFRTGELARYNADGSISLVGTTTNRVRVGGRTIQLEELERVLLACAGVRAVVVSTRITAGRTQLIAVVCFEDLRLPRATVLQRLPLTGRAGDIASTGLDTVRAWAHSMLSPDRVPTIWMAVERLPLMTTQRVDRAAVRAWLKTVRS